MLKTFIQKQRIASLEASTKNAKAEQQQLENLTLPKLALGIASIAFAEKAINKSAGTKNENLLTAFAAGLGITNYVFKKSGINYRDKKIKKNEEKINKIKETLK